MASHLEHMSLTTFLGYHGTTVADPLIGRYAEMYDNFTVYRYNVPQISIDKAFIKWLQQNVTLPAIYSNQTSCPYQLPTQNHEPIVVSATPISTTTVIESSNQAVQSLIAEYLDDEPFYKLSEQPTTPPANSPDATLSLSSLSTTPSPPPEPQDLPLLQTPLAFQSSSQTAQTPLLSFEPPTTHSQQTPLPPLIYNNPQTPVSMTANQLAPKKDLTAMKEEHEQKKRKRTANIQPQQQQKSRKRKSGRPSTVDTLTRIANDKNDNDYIYSQDLILRALDGSEKKKKTILTCSDKSIELYYLKQYGCYDFIADLRKKALDTIKEQKNILEKLLHIEQMVTQGIEPSKI